MKVLSRKESIKSGLSRYFTGKLCPKGHTSERYVSNNGCIGCLRADYKTYASKNSDRIRATRKSYLIKNKDKIKKVLKRYNDLNKSTRNAQSREWRRLNLEKQKALQKVWYSSERGRAISNFHSAKRRAILLQASPPWLSDAQLREIGAFYHLAQSYNIKMHVDHIIPLQGRLVSGLHVPWNLQILTEGDNCKKGNRHEV